MGREILGLIRCPICGADDATVHLQMSSTAKKYYRCYTEAGGMMSRCGTIQALGPSGQAYINANLRPYQPATVSKGVAPANDPIGVKTVEPAPPPAPKAAANDPIDEPKPAKRSLLNSFLHNLTVEED